MSTTVVIHGDGVRDDTDNWQLVIDGKARPVNKDGTPFHGEVFIKAKGDRNIKMSDVFDLPYADNGYNDLVTANYDQTKAAIHAINSHDALTERVKVLEAALTDAKAEADSLAMSIFNRHYKENSTVGFELLDDVRGVISQIDNMVVGLFNRIDNLECAMQTDIRKTGGNLRLEEALKAVNY